LGGLAAASLALLGRGGRFRRCAGFLACDRWRGFAGRGVLRTGRTICLFARSVGDWWIGRLLRKGPRGRICTTKESAQDCQDQHPPPLETQSNHLCLFRAETRMPEPVRFQNTPANLRRLTLRAKALLIFKCNSSQRGKRCASQIISFASLRYLRKLAPITERSSSARLRTTSF